MNKNYEVVLEVKDEVVKLNNNGEVTLAYKGEVVTTTVPFETLEKLYNSHSVAILNVKELA
jgi:hypothetical protein